MAVYTIKRYTRELIQAHSDKIFVFGDNLYRTGYGGQAAAARDEENTLGIITKFSPSNDDDSFFNDNQLELYKKLTVNDFALLEMYNLDSGFDIVIPYDGIGTGLSDLQNRAPKILDFIEHKFFSLIVEYEYGGFQMSFEDYCYFKSAVQIEKMSLVDFISYVLQTKSYYADGAIGYPYKDASIDSIRSFYLQNTNHNDTDWRDFALKFEEHFDCA